MLLFKEFPQQTVQRDIIIDQQNQRHALTHIFVNRQTEMKLGAFSGNTSAFDLKPASVRLDQLAGKIQPKPVTGDIRLDAAAIKLAHQMLLFFELDPDPVIFNADLHTIAVAWSGERRSRRLVAST